MQWLVGSKTLFRSTRDNTVMVPSPARATECPRLLECLSTARAAVICTVWGSFREPTVQAYSPKSFQNTSSCPSHQGLGSVLGMRPMRAHRGALKWSVCAPNQSHGEPDV